MGIIQPNIHRILRKVNQVICMVYPNSDPSLSDSPDILLTNLLYYTKMPKLEKEENSAKCLQNFAKS